MHDAATFTFVEIDDFLLAQSPNTNSKVSYSEVLPKAHAQRNASPVQSRLPLVYCAFYEVANNVAIICLGVISI